MEVSTLQKVAELKRKGVCPLYSIWIVHEKEDQTFAVNVWDEVGNEREETMEEGFKTFKEAEQALICIVNEHPEITFVRLPNEEN